MFGKKKDNSAFGLQSLTSGILQVFKDTMENLKAVNEVAKTEISNQETIIINATEEKNRYQELMASNDKIINNINQNFL